MVAKNSVIPKSVVTRPSIQPNQFSTYSGVPVIDQPIVATVSTTNVAASNSFSNARDVSHIQHPIPQVHNITKPTTTISYISVPSGPPPIRSIIPTVQLPPGPNTIFRPLGMYILY